MFPEAVVDRTQRTVSEYDQENALIIPLAPCGDTEHLVTGHQPRGYKTFFMLNSIAHEISTAHKTKQTIKEVSCF